ncbi:MAG: Uncharacterised protein [Candidatus Poseidoniaceae archaeon]|nr:MAG: Uncharacterised protein [Candidatus Poseidoniaceae archaeon]
MPPFWPFKRTSKKEEVIDEMPPAPIVYRKGQDVHTEKHSTTEERNESAYKDALALFGGGDTMVVASSNVVDEYDGVSNEQTDETTLEAEPEFEWVHHSDGYHYKKFSDGAFEPTAYVKNADGLYSEYV